MVKMHMVAAINSAIDSAMNKDDKVVVFGEDIAKNGGVFRVTDNLLDKYGSSRIFNTPIAESAIVGMGIGMAINGLRPVCEIQFCGFTYQAFAQVKQHMARFAQRTNGEMRLPMVLRAPSSGGIRALEHHSESPEAFFIHCQGLRVVMPSGPYDAKGLFLSAVKSDDPVVFLEPKKIYRSFKEDVPEEDYEIDLDKANVMREGSDITIITWGATRKLCENVCDKYEKQGTSIELIDLRSLWPLDIDTLAASVEKTGKCVIVSEETRSCSLASEVSAQINERCALKLSAPVRRVTGPDVPMPQFALENFHLTNEKRIELGIKKVLDF